mmetsp:Transcript_24894/g.77485  ORF Transcript_24894/g.77485 Transcript_24894/m.77485 type:complete len:245 (-) Transcript_24894:1082-1816(-)
MAQPACMHSREQKRATRQPAHLCLVRASSPQPRHTTLHVSWLQAHARISPRVTSHDASSAPSSPATLACLCMRRASTRSSAPRAASPGHSGHESEACDASMRLRPRQRIARRRRGRALSQSRCLEKRSRGLAGPVPEAACVCSLARAASVSSHACLRLRSVPRPKRAHSARRTWASISPTRAASRRRLTPRLSASWYSAPSRAATLLTRKSPKAFWACEKPAAAARRHKSVLCSRSRGTPAPSA